MIVSVVRSYPISPFDIDRLFLDAQDHVGLEYWYNDAAKVDKSLTDLDKKDEKEN